MDVDSCLLGIGCCVVCEREYVEWNIYVIVVICYVLSGEIIL